MKTSSQATTQESSYVFFIWPSPRFAGKFFGRPSLLFHRGANCISGTKSNDTYLPHHCISGHPPQFAPLQIESHTAVVRQEDLLSLMFFILVMDILCLTVIKASDKGLLQPLAARAMQKRISLYASDVLPWFTNNAILAF